MGCQVQHDAGLSIISISGRFVFDLHREFRDAYEAANKRPETKVIQLNMSEVDYLDSSALGMMLLMRERSEMAGKKVAIKGVSAFVNAILMKTANFEKLFEIAA